MAKDQYMNHGFAEVVSDTLYANRVETIDLTPTWAGILPGLLAVVRNAESFEAQVTAEDELTKMARLADRYVAATKRAGGFVALERLLDGVK